MSNEIEIDTLPDGTRVNIIKQRDQFYFYTDLMPENLPRGGQRSKQLRRVPENLLQGLPFVQYNNRIYGYLPVDVVDTYFQTDEFKQRVNRYSPPGEAEISGLLVVPRMIRDLLKRYENYRNSPEAFSRPGPQPTEIDIVTPLENLGNIPEALRGLTPSGIQAQRREWSEEKRAAAAANIRIVDRNGNPITSPSVAANPFVPRGAVSPNATDAATRTAGQMGSTVRDRTALAREGATAWSGVQAAFRTDPKGRPAVGMNSDGILQRAGDQAQMLIEVNPLGRATVISAEDYLARLNSMNRSQRAALQKTLAGIEGLNYNGPTDGSRTYGNVFEAKALEFATWATQQNYNLYTQTNNGTNLGVKPKSFSELIDEISGGGGAGGTNVSRTIQEASFTREDAKKLLDAYYTEALGRKATKKEVNQFTKVLQRRAAERPTVQTATTTTDAAGNSTTRLQMREGFGVEQATALAQRRAETQPEFRPYQMATTYYDAFMEILASPIGGNR